MIGRAMRADWLKIRRKGLWLLAIIAPVGLIAMQALNYGLRYDYLMEQYAHDPWGELLKNILLFVPISLFLGATLISSLLANIEHHMSSWKQLLALPISRTAVLTAKFLISLILLSFSCLLLSIGTLALGAALKLPLDSIPYGDILRIGFVPLLASLPMLALSLWLCMTYKNQTLPVTFGVVIAIMSMFTMTLSEYLPINWPLFSYYGPQQELFAGAGIACGILILLLGAIHFARKDVG